MLELNVLKVGGAVVEDPAALACFVNNFASLQGLKVMVHGGGRTATDVSARLGIETQMINGRRVTDAETLKVVTAVYTGLVNKNIVARLQDAGVNAFGMCGADFGFMRSVRRPITREGIDYGFVGDVVQVQTDAVASLLEKGLVPVVAPITHDGAGQLLNTNADTVASETAKGLSGSFDVTLTYCFEKEGVLDAEGKVIPEITPSVFEALKADGTIAGGMIPKLENAFAALAAGVKAVRITSAQSLSGGTLVVL